MCEDWHDPAGGSFTSCQHSPVPQKHSRPIAGGRGYWLTENLWAAAEGLPTYRVPISEIPELDEDCWFDGRAPTCRQVAEHARRIGEVDLAYPVIFAADGRLMDGGHRIARAWLEGQTEIDAVRFTKDPDPDWIEPSSG